MKNLNKKCDCGTMTERRIMTTTVPIRRQKVTLQNVEVDVCPACGEIFLDGNLILEVSRKVKNQNLKAA